MRFLFSLKTKGPFQEYETSILQTHIFIILLFKRFLINQSKTFHKHRLALNLYARHERYKNEQISVPLKKIDIAFPSLAHKLSYITPTLRSYSVSSVWKQSLHIGSGPFPLHFCCDLILTAAELAVCLPNFAKGDNTWPKKPLHFPASLYMGCSHDKILTNKISGEVTGCGIWERSFEKVSSALHLLLIWNTDVLGVVG